MSISENERTLTCIICPRGCQLHVELDGKTVRSVTGNSCPRGKAYAESECTHPVRTLTSTVRSETGEMIPVKSSEPIPKESLFDAMKEVNALVAPAHTRAGDVLLPSLAGTTAALVATDSAQK